MTADPRVVAAVDFGTHGTGYAWTITDDPRGEPFFYSDWKSQPAADVKNLSALLLEPDGSLIEWGHEARRRHSAERVADRRYRHGFKMSLMPGEAASRNGDGLPAVIDDRAADPVHLVTTYLAQMYQVALARIVSAGAVRPDEIRWCLTVPAIWGDREKQLMRTAAERAGFPPDGLVLAIEPEAAALYCRERAGFIGIDAPGSRFVVVDAGGGTVDITSYEVAQDGRLVQLGFASGGRLGAAFLDRRFIDRVVEERLGRDLTGELTDDSRALLELLDEWERVKRTFDPTQHQPLNIRLPNWLVRLLDQSHPEVVARLARQQGGVDDAVVLQPHEVRAVFDTVVDPILELVDQQLRAIGARRTEHVLLVGGFAQSSYLQARLTAHLRGRVARVLVPPNPGAAVLWGAVRYGQRPAAIKARRTTLTYGVRTNMSFERFRDPRGRRFTDGYGVVRCRDRFAVFVPAGETVEVGKAVTRSCFPSEPSQEYILFDVYASTERDPRYTDSPGSRKVGELRVDVSGTVGRRAEEREVRITMFFGGTEIEVEGTDVHSGQRVSTTISFAGADG